MYVHKCFEWIGEEFVFREICLFSVLLFTFILLIFPLSMFWWLISDMHMYKQICIYKNNSNNM